MRISPRPTRFDRQSFLGPNAPALILQTRVAIVGLGGGGSHVHQQLSHAGFEQLSVFDDDFVDLTNLNRLIGATVADAERGALKIEVAQRLYKGLHLNGRLRAFPSCRAEHRGTPLRAAFKKDPRQVRPVSLLRTSDVRRLDG